MPYDGSKSMLASSQTSPSAILPGVKLDARHLFFSIGKRAFDLVVSIALLPLLALCFVALSVLNLRFNKGPVWFVQERMGKNCIPFNAIKFRTMTPTDQISRGADDPLEVDRITTLGRFLRKSRIDELPQILNVLLGEMSLIGPRPDYYKHACQYVDAVPGYRERHAVLPGISGLAQTEMGYIEGLAATRAKVRYDLHYVRNRSFALDTFIFLNTLKVVLNRKGA